MSVSNDNKKFTDVAKLKSSGDTNGIESYNLKEVSARIVRITVTANTENNFASIVEIAIGSKKSSDPSPPHQVLISVITLTFPYLMLPPVEVNQGTLHRVLLITTLILDGQIKDMVHGYDLISGM